MQALKQKKIKSKGATMRLGSYPCSISSKTNAYKAYRKRKINERHRHRYEVNNQYVKLMEKSGLIISGVNQKLNLVEMIEVKQGPYSAKKDKQKFDFIKDNKIKLK